MGIDENMMYIGLGKQWTGEATAHYIFGE